MPGYGYYQSSMQAWRAWIAFAEERERGLVHTPEYVKQMNQLETDLRAENEAQDLLQRVLAAADRREARP